MDGVGGAVDGLNGGLLKGVLGRRDGGLLGTVGQVTNGLPVVGGLTQQVTDGLANGHPVSGVVGTVNGLVGTVGNVLPGGLGNTVTGLTGGLLGGVGATADGLLAPVTGQNGLLNGVIGQDGVVGGLLGNSGLVGGVLGDQGLVGGLLGGGQGSLLGNDGLVGGLLGDQGLVGGLLGGLLGGAKKAETAPKQSDPLAIIKQQGGVVRDLGNGQFLTSAGGIVHVPLNLAAQLGGLLSQVTQTAQGTVNKVASAATAALPAPLAGVAGAPLGAAQGVLGIATGEAGGAIDTAGAVAKSVTGTAQGVLDTASKAAGGPIASGPVLQQATGALDLGHAASSASSTVSNLAGTASTVSGLTATLPVPDIAIIQNLLSNSPLAALGNLSKVDIASLSPSDLQQLAAFASGSLPASSALMQNLAVDPAALNTVTRASGIPGTAMGGNIPAPTAVTSQAVNALGATPIGAMIGAGSHAAPSPISSLASAASSIASDTPTGTGKVPSSDAARAMASQIVQNGQQLSDDEYAEKIQALKDQLARMTAAASGSAGDAAGQQAAARLNALLALGNGLTNAELGEVRGIQLGPQGATVVPTSSAVPSAAPSAVPQAIGTIASIPGTEAEQQEFDDCSSCDEEEWGTDEEYSDDEGVAQILNADVYPNFFSGDNEVLGVAQAQGSSIGLASATSATHIAASAITSAPVPTGSTAPIGAIKQVGSAIRSVSSGYLPATGLPTGTASVSGAVASATMIPQNSSRLA